METYNKNIYPTRLPIRHGTPSRTFLTPSHYYEPELDVTVNYRPWRRNYWRRLIWARASSRVTHLSRSYAKMLLYQRVVVKIEEVPLADSCLIASRNSPKRKRYLSPTHPVWWLSCDWWPARPQDRGWGERPRGPKDRELNPFPILRHVCKKLTGQNLFQEMIRR